MPLVEWRNHLSLARLFVARNRPAAGRESLQRADLLLREVVGHITDSGQRENLSRIAAVREVQAGAMG